MNSDANCDDLVRHLSATLGLEPALAARVIGETMAYLDESVEQYVQRRHRELQSEGVSNPQAFERIRGEVAARRFATQALSIRQVRRLIYG